MNRDEAQQELVRRYAVARRCWRGDPRFHELDERTYADAVVEGLEPLAYTGASSTPRPPLDYHAAYTEAGRLVEEGGDGG